MFTDQEKRERRKIYDARYYQKNKGKWKTWNHQRYKNHKEEICEKGKQYYAANKLIIAKRNFLYLNKLKREVINHYGGKCVHCGETDIFILTIDHIDGGGIKHFKEIHRNFYRWLKDNNYPKKGFQVLCRNCNWRKWINERIKLYSTI